MSSAACQTETARRERERERGSRGTNTVRCEDDATGGWMGKAAQKAAWKRIAWRFAGEGADEETGRGLRGCSRQHS